MEALAFLLALGCTPHASIVYDATLEQSQFAIMEKLEKIDKQLTRYHGFLGGVAFLVTGIGVGWNLLGDWIKSQLQ